jgi:hypothetical protein
VDDLITWLRAQVDDDERVARSMFTGGDWRWLGDAIVDRDVDGWRSAPDDAVIITLRHDREEVGGHIARHDPARVLAGVEAKRQIIELHEVARTSRELSADAWIMLKQAVQHLATVYADQPGYRDEWRP